MPTAVEILAETDRPTDEACVAYRTLVISVAQGAKLPKREQLRDLLDAAQVPAAEFDEDVQIVRERLRLTDPAFADEQTKLAKAARKAKDAAEHAEREVERLALALTESKVRARELLDRAKDLEAAAIGHDAERDVFLERTSHPYRREVEAWHRALDQAAARAAGLREQIRALDRATAGLADLEHEAAEAQRFGRNGADSLAVRALAMRGKFEQIEPLREQLRAAEAEYKRVYDLATKPPLDPPSYLQWDAVDLPRRAGRG